GFECPHDGQARASAAHPHAERLVSGFSCPHDCHATGALWHFRARYPTSMELTWPLEEPSCRVKAASQRGRVGQVVETSVRIAGDASRVPQTEPPVDWR